jgi:hypothetical protein
MSTEGIVYVLTNPAMPGMVKIGKTSRAMDARLNELYSTGVPLPFECAYAARVSDEGTVERAFHLAFGPYRVNPKREFFSIEPEQAIALLRLMEIEDVTPQVQREADSVDVDAKPSAERLKRARRPVMNYLEIGLPVGAMLIYQDGTTTCTVVDGRHVNYNGEERFLSAITAELMGIPGKPIHGGRYWSYEGRNLLDLYEEVYSEDGIMNA